MSDIRLIDANALKTAMMKAFDCEDATKYGNTSAEQQAHSYSTLMLYEISNIVEDCIDNAPTVDLRLMKVEECAGHTIDYAMGWKACIEWLKQGGDTQYFDKENKE